MAAPKFYKCGYTHCAFPEKKVAPEDNPIKIRSLYYHKECEEIKTNCERIRDTYIGCVSSAVVRSQLCGVINRLVFGEKLRNPNVTPTESNLEASKFLLFALNYAINNNIRINSPLGLYYLIDNQRIKDAWTKKKDLKIEKEMRADKIDFGDAKVTEFKPTTPFKNPTTFSDIFGSSST